MLAGGEPETGGEAILPLAPFYTKLNDILDRKLAAVQQIQNVYVENHTYIDGDEVSSRTVNSDIVRIIPFLSRPLKYTHIFKCPIVTSVSNSVGCNAPVIHS